MSLSAARWSYHHVPHHGEDHTKAGHGFRQGKRRRQRARDEQKTAAHVGRDAHQKHASTKGQ